MGRKGYSQLSRRERQIMDIIYKEGQATVAEVLDALSDPPSYSAVRAMLRILEEKGHLVHESDGPRYIFKPTLPREEARRSAVMHLLKTFFNDSTEEAMAALLDISHSPLSDESYERIRVLIDQAREEEEGQ